MRKKLPHSTADAPTETEVQTKAYHLWIEGGCLEGVELDNWLTAKECLRHRIAPRSPAAPAPRARRTTR